MTEPGPNQGGLARVTAVRRASLGLEGRCPCRPEQGDLYALVLSPTTSMAPSSSPPGSGRPLSTR